MVVSAWAAARKSAPAEFRLDGAVKLSEAMEEQWRWAEFGKEDGLPSAEIVQILETEDGTVWVNTTAGVAWYDGYQWQKNRCESERKKSVPSQIQPFGKESVTRLSPGCAQT